MKDKEEINRKQADQIDALEKEKKVLLQTIKKHEMEIEKLKGQQIKEVVKANQEETILTPKEKRQHDRYA